MESHTLKQVKEMNDWKVTRAAFNAIFEKYRSYKAAVNFRAKEATITPAYVPRYHGATNATSDQTAEIAIYNVDNQIERQTYCEKIETAVSELEEDEKKIICERYMKRSRVLDYVVFKHVMDPAICERTYSKIRKKSFDKLLLMLEDMEVTIDV
ncbi:transcriptional regulator [Paenibacillus sp. MBLB4367]|uniref:transcriptional regulator n=1 Tax=Paenibacillus sp. MBLB4367 TaxID=3384767 RepID=UPI00390814EC